MPRIYFDDDEEELEASEGESTSEDFLFDISKRVSSPSPAEIKRCRLQAGLSQMRAAKIISSVAPGSYKTWSGYEQNEGTVNHRKMPLAAWEIFLLMTNQHPTLELKMRN